MENYTRIIESLSVGFKSVSVVRLREGLAIHGFYELEDVLIFVQSGQLFYEKDKKELHSGEVLFIPPRRRIDLSFGDSSPSYIISGGLQGEQKDFLEQPIDAKSDGSQVFCILRLNVNVFNAINLFPSLDVGTFVIRDDETITDTIKVITNEFFGKEIAKKIMLTCKSKELVMHILRHIIRNQLFVQQITTNINNLRDDRLITLLRYIKENLSGDLTNKQLANTIQLSEDYVGQYFKSLTGINPQDYVEFQRMQHAIELLRGTPKSIYTIGKEVGYKDSSYFCRRFKMMFGISAGRMRRREGGVPTM